MNKTITSILEGFPKRRPTLPPAYSERYVLDYLTNRSGTNLAARITAALETWMHRQVAARRHGEHILELGAGTLNHLRFESGFARYDAIEPFTELWRDQLQTSLISRMYSNLAEVPPVPVYDRVLSVAVLEHLEELPSIVARCALLLAPGGVFAAGIPSEGALLWYLAWRYGSGTAYRLRTGLDYRPLMRHEHINSAAEIAAVLDHFFENVERCRFPTPYFHFSLYSAFLCCRPRVIRCREYLSAKITHVRSRD